MKKLALDIETENTGTDIMGDNKRIISVQIGNAVKQELYYDDSKTSGRSLIAAKARISSLVSEGVVFAGYNVKGFDVPLLKEHLGIEIPDENLLEIQETEGVQRICRSKNKRYLKLEDVCGGYNISVGHKEEMNREAEKLKTRSDIVKTAQEAANKKVINDNWTPKYAYDKMIEKLTVGIAIYNSYLKFVESDGLPDTLFHRYAVGDVISEYRLLQAVSS